MAAVSKPKPTVLLAVVDDHVYTATFIAQELENKGFRTIKAFNGNEAIKLCQTEKPDLVLLDVTLPDISGFEVAAKLKGMKILFMTGETDLFGKAKSTPGSVGVISKPVDMPELFVILKKIFKLP